MNSLPACPSDEQLAAFVAGRLDDDVAKSLAEHCDCCPLCQMALQKFVDEPPNPLLAILRKPNSNPETVTDPQCRPAVERVAALAEGTGNTLKAKGTPRTPRLGRFGDYDLLEVIAQAAWGWSTGPGNCV